MLNAVLNICLVFEVVSTPFTYLGFQEYARRASVFDLGREERHPPV